MRDHSHSLMRACVLIHSHALLAMLSHGGRGKGTPMGFPVCDNCALVS